MTIVLSVTLDASALLLCLSGGKLRERFGKQLFHVVAESMARAMADKIVDIMFAGRDLFTRFPSIQPAGGFMADPVRGEVNFGVHYNLLKNI